MLKHVLSREAKITLYRWVEIEKKTAAGKFMGRSGSREDKGTRTGMVDLYIDLERILDALAERALRSKSGQSRSQHGAIVVKVRRGTTKNQIIDPSLPDRQMIEEIVPEPPPRDGAIRISQQSLRADLNRLGAELAKKL